MHHQMQDECQCCPGGPLQQQTPTQRGDKHILSAHRHALACASQCEGLQGRHPDQCISEHIWLGRSQPVNGQLLQPAQSPDAPQSSRAEVR
jgi:hypothetical protein